MTNEKLAENLASNYSKACGLEEPKCEYCKTKHCEYRDIRNGALMMAEQKDKDLKKFLIEHIDIPYTKELSPDGQPYAIDYIEWFEERDKAATEMFEKFKSHEG